MPTRSALDGRFDRYYDPSTDQFLSVDPDLAETGQPYAFTGDDPLNATDPMGLSPGIRNKLLSETESPELKSILNELYRPGAKIGNGGTAAALEEEVKLGELTQNASGALTFTHYEKAYGYMKNLAKLVRSKALGASDQEIAVGQLKALQTAVRSATSSLDTSVEVGAHAGIV